MTQALYAHMSNKKIKIKIYYYFAARAYTEAGKNLHFTGDRTFQNQIIRTKPLLASPS
jgi:hypothetical protein